MTVRVRPVEARDLDAWASMRTRLLPHAVAGELGAECRAALLGRARSALPLATFVADEDGLVVGYVEVGLRSHAMCCDPLRSVGYLEEWYVEEGARRRGVGSALVRAAEDWARAQGCIEMASDTPTSNLVSQRAHAKLGYEAPALEPLVVFRKRL